MKTVRTSLKCNMNSALSTDVYGGLIKAVILLVLTSSCMTSPVFKTPPTTEPTSTTIVMENISLSFNTTAAGNVTCTSNGCGSSDRLNLAVTVFLRVLLIIVCLFVFVALVKLSDILNRRCTCKKKGNVYFTKL